MNGKMKKAVGWGGGLAIVATLAIIVNFDKALGVLGKVSEPYYTVEIREKVDEVEDKVMVLARTEDAKTSALKKDLVEMERRLIDKMSENNREQIRLIVQALRNRGGTP
jgi:hypothetical protein